MLRSSPEAELAVLIRVHLGAFAIGAVHTVRGRAHSTQLAQRQVICPALVLRPTEGNPEHGVNESCIAASAHTDLSYISVITKGAA